MYTFADPGVIEKSKGFLMVKVDLTSSGDTRAEALRKKYEARGVPTLVFLDPDGEEMPELRVIGFEPADVFLEKMTRALELSAGRRKSTG